ncbi:MAG: hypothetical protein IT380_12975 [Myxococcales bacterium]|nr:hypothetical protein [Myxococcales bacterium]
MSPFLQQLHDYFRGERAGALYFLVPSGAGLLLLAGVAAWVEQGGSALGMALPLFVFGAFLLGVGLVVGLRTPGQVAALEAKYAESPKALVEEELPRMREVNATWPVSAGAHLFVVLVGLLLRFAVHADRAQGLGPALVLAGAVGFVFDGFVERRAEPYTEALEALAKENGVAPP